MHTTHSHLLKLRKAAALCAALFLCACNYERIPDVEEGELMTVTLSAGPAAGRAKPHHQSRVDRHAGELYP